MARARTNVRGRDDADDDFLDQLDGGAEVLRAVRRGDLEQLKTLLASRPALVEKKGHMGRRPLHIAVEAANLRLIAFLLEAGADVDGRRARGDTPLFWSPTAKVTNLLLGKGASIHAKDCSGREPIHWAAQFERPDVIDVLLQHGSDVNVRDDESRTPLHWATGACGFPGIVEITSPRAFDCVRILVEHGADVNARDGHGRVPLHGVAVLPDMHQRLVDGELKYDPGVPDAILGIIRLLLDHGADPTMKDDDGKSPRSISSGATRKAFARWKG